MSEIDAESAKSLHGAVGEITAVSGANLNKVSDALEALGYGALESGEEASLAARIYREQDAKRADPLVVFGSGSVGAIIGLSGGAVESILGAAALAVVATLLKYLIDRDSRMNAVVAAVVEFRRLDGRQA